MNFVRLISVPMFAVLALSACQSSQSKQAELASICANPYNRAPGSFYFTECQTIAPSASSQLQRNYLLEAPTGD